MKILIATGIYPPEIGGPATYTVLLERMLPRRGHQVTVLPFRVSRGYPKALRHLRYLYMLCVKARGVHVIFAQDVASVGFPALLTARLMGKRFFVRVPGDYAWEQATQRFGVVDTIDAFQKKTYGFRVRFLRFIQRSVTAYADTVITPSEYFKTLVVGWGVPAEKVHTIYNGVDLAIEPESVKKPASLVMVSAGRLVPWKGFEVLIRTMPQLPNWHLVILGDGPERKKLQAIIDELALGHRVHLQGTVTREEVFGWCTTADAFVLNTSFESFSFQIVEAMAAGVPVIATNVGSLPELITSEKEGLLIVPDDIDAFLKAVKSVVTDKATWQQRVHNAQLKAQKFTIEHTVDALNTLLVP